MEKNPKNFESRISNLESQLIPILSTPISPEIAQSSQHVVSDFNQYVNFIDIVSAEKPSSDAPHRFADVVHRVKVLQNALHDWTKGRPFVPSARYSDASQLSSYNESCITDDSNDNDREQGEGVGVAEGGDLAGFKVCNNPLFVGSVDDDSNVNVGTDIEEDEEVKESEVGEGVHYQHEVDEGVKEDKVDEGVHYHDKVDEGVKVQGETIRVQCENEDDGFEAVTEEDMGKEVIRLDDQKEVIQEVEKGTQNGCLKTIFWSIVTGMGIISMIVGFSDVPDHHQSVMFLTPT